MSSPTVAHDVTYSPLLRGQPRLTFETLVTRLLRDHWEMAMLDVSQTLLVVGLGQVSATSDSAESIAWLGDRHTGAAPAGTNDPPQHDQ